MKKNAYDLILAKQAELAGIITKCATENRAPSEDETTQLTAIKAEIDGIKAEWESSGRSAFLASLNTNKRSDEQIFLKSDESFADHLKGTYPEEQKALSIRRILKGYITGDWAGAELEQKAMGSSPLSSGGIMIPTPIAGSVIDLARAATRVIQAGAITVPMNAATLKYARLDSDASANWVLEGNNIPLSASTFDSVTFTAHKLAALVAVNNELLEDAPNSDAVIEDSIGRAIALALDYAALYGPGVAPQPQGLHGIIPAIAENTYPTYDMLLAAIAAVRAYNFEPNAAIYSPRTARDLAKLKTSTGEYLALPPDVVAIQRYTTNQVPINLGTGTNESQAFVGQWNQLALGLRASLQIEVSREASYFDGSNLQSGFSRDQTMIRAILRADWQPLHTSAFAELTGILPQTA